MKFLKWKTLVVTCLVCIIPVFLGMALWNELPDTMAIHFNINNQPDNYASKEFTVFGLPLLMIVLQFICCVINDINAYKHGERKKFEMATKWIIPVMTIILQIITYGYGLGWNIDIRKNVALIVGMIFVLIGNYLPKFDCFKESNADTTKTRKINRFIGVVTVILGLLFIASIFMPPLSTVFCIILIIPYAIICIAYSIIIVKKN